MSEHDERFTDLQERLMHQERLLEKLDEIVTEQQKAIDRLRRDLTHLTDQVVDGPSEDVEEPPPHY